MPPQLSVTKKNATVASSPYKPAQVPITNIIVAATCRASMAPNKVALEKRWSSRRFNWLAPMNPTARNAKMPLKARALRWKLSMKTIGEPAT